MDSSHVRKRRGARKLVQESAEEIQRMQMLEETLMDFISGEEDHASDETKKEVATSLREKLKSLTRPSITCCIYRVPQKLRKVNMEAYTPRVVSIGPLHHRERHLVAMEELKLRYLDKFLSKSCKTLEECVEIISREEKRARDRYMDPINMSSKEFVEMILVDGCFIIELILGFQKWDGCTGRKSNDWILNKPWLIFDVRRDMFLLENQLPFFLLFKLYSLLDVRAVLPFQNCYYSFLFFSVNFFKYHMQMPESKSCEEISKTISKVYSTPEGIKHFVHLLMVCQQPSSLVCQQPSSPTRLRKPSDFKNMIPTATQLHEAGLRFELGSKKERLLDIDYRRSDGVLRIPKIVLGDMFDALFRNLIAFEQCHYRKDTYISDYIFLLDQLINTTEDVDVLVNKGIIENWLGDNVAVANMFNNLLINTVGGADFYFEDIFEGINEYCDVPWKRWKAALRRDYFCSPWRGASTIAAVILLLLTLIQTIFSGMSVK